MDHWLQVLIHHLVVVAQLGFGREVGLLLGELPLLMRLGDQILTRHVIGQRRQRAVPLPLPPQPLLTLQRHELLILNRDVTCLRDAVVSIAAAIVRL